MTLITRKFFNSAAVLAFAALAFGSSAQAEGNLTVYCSVQEEWCQSMVNEFQKATGITVAMTRKSSGETFAHGSGALAFGTRNIPLASASIVSRSIQTWPRNVGSITL